MGAIYNGQYAKGLVHVAVIGVLISILNADIPEGPLVALMLVAFWAYMPFEAYHTARKPAVGPSGGRFFQPGADGRLAISGRAGDSDRLGTVLLLDNLGIFELRRMLRYWPVLLIGAGVYMLYSRFSGSKDPSHEPPPPCRHRLLEPLHPRCGP